MYIQLALILNLGVVEEISVNPESRLSFARPRAKFVDDARDRHKLHHVRVADNDFVEQNVAARMIVALAGRCDGLKLKAFVSTEESSGGAAGFNELTGGNGSAPSSIISVARFNASAGTVLVRSLYMVAASE